MTIKEIADEAGVSVATVSRVINKDEKVSPKTMKKVREVIDRCGYVPNELGRHLRRSNTGTILVLLPSMGNTFYPNLVKGIDEECGKNNYNSIITNTYDSYSKTLEYCDWLRRKLADGIILISPKISHDYSALKGKMIVGCSDMHPKFPCPQVDIDNRKAAYDAVTHLISCGCKKIAFLGGHSASAYSRYEGYCDALKEAGIPTDKNLEVHTCVSYLDTCELCKKLLDNETFDGLFAISDEFALAFMHIAESRGIKIPGQIKVVGFDNGKMSLMTNPELTTVEQPGEESGRCAVQTLLGMINGKPVQDKFYFGHKLIIRGSSVKGAK